MTLPAGPFKGAGTLFKYGTAGAAPATTVTSVVDISGGGISMKKIESTTLDTAATTIVSGNNVIFDTSIAGTAAIDPYEVTVEATTTEYATLQGMVGAVHSFGAFFPDGSSSSSGSTLVILNGWIEKISGWDVKLNELLKYKLTIQSTGPATFTPAT